MPETYADAVAEVEFWHRRNDDMELAVTADGGLYGDYMLDAPALWRMWIVRDLAEHEMELRTLSEIVARMRAYRQSETGRNADVEDAILRDLDALQVRANDGDLLSAIRRSIAPLVGCEDAKDDYRACVPPSCSCMKAACEIAALVVAREITT